MKSLQPLFFLILLLFGFLLPVSLKAEQNIALILRFHGNIYLNGKPVGADDRVLHYHDALKFIEEDAYLEVFNLEATEKEREILRLTSADADGKQIGEILGIHKRAGKQAGQHDRLISLLTTKAKSSATLIARSAGNSNLQYMYPGPVDEFYHLSGNRLCFRWRSSESNMGNASFQVSISSPSGRELDRTVSQPETCFSIPEKLTGLVKWQVQIPNSEDTLEGECYLGNRNEFSFLSENLDFPPDSDVTLSAFLKRAECLLEQELDYEAYLTLRNGYLRFPDVTLFSRLIEQMEKSRK